jgi:hypothetical protein
LIGVDARDTECRLDVVNMLDKAEIQLTNYMITKKFLDRKGLKGFVVICHGETLIWRAHKGFPII